MSFFDDTISQNGADMASVRVSVHGVKSLGGHFATLCWGFDFYEVKKDVIFQKEKGNTFTLLIIFIVKSIAK